MHSSQGAGPVVTPPEGESKGRSETAALCTVHVRGTVLQLRKALCKVVTVQGGWAELSDRAGVELVAEWHISCLSA
jgi:hypothetical protein